MLRKKATNTQREITMRFSVKLATLFIIVSGATMGFASAAAASDVSNSTPAVTDVTPMSSLTLIWD